MGNCLFSLSAFEPQKVGETTVRVTDPAQSLALARLRNATQPTRLSWLIRPDRVRSRWRQGIHGVVRCSRANDPVFSGGGRGVATVSHNARGRRPAGGNLRRAYVLTIPPMPSGSIMLLGHRRQDGYSAYVCHTPLGEPGV